jgi:hypothetical protein
MARRQRDVVAELGELQQRAVEAGRRERDARSEIDSAERILQELNEQRVEAYADADEQRAGGLTADIQVPRSQLDQTRARAEGLARAAEAARAELVTFRSENARALLEAREPRALEVTATLNAAVAEVLRLNREYIAERTEQDRAVAAVPGASPRLDGPPGTHPWEQALQDLERVVRECPQLGPPVPTWRGVGHREQQNSVNRLERLRRKKRRDERDQAEIDHIGRELGLTPNVDVI